ncbi:MAG TPA: M20/M25/M40 family metallo-hydrolase, partial [Chthonomonadales bacterium]|nr:M20/M25/M40 family metallo-hydrolase [Chthonomonadales bacterium]
YKGVAEVVYLDANDEAGLQKYKGRLKGAIVLMSPPAQAPLRFSPMGVRYTDEQLEAMAQAQPQTGVSRRPFAGRRAAFLSAFRLATEKMQFLSDEGAALVVEPSRAGTGGTLFVQSAIVPQSPDTPFQNRINPWKPDAPKYPPQIVVAAEHYNRMVRMIQQGVNLRMAVDLEVQFNDNPDQKVYNTIAEIPGSDLKDQIVMLGGHMDSWHGATGATDNGVGVAVCMEAVRILEAAGLKPRRTIRIALWTGEEEGLFGSRGYVRQHLGYRTAPPGAPQSFFGPTTGPITRGPEWNKVSAYYNLDNGSGKIRGIYLQGNSAVKPIFDAWLTPFHDLGATTTTIRNTGSTDHVSFDAVDVPGFQFIQDPLEYETMTHHSNMDLYDHASADDLKQAATIMAAFVYETAMRDEMIPRKPENPQVSAAN